MTVFTLHQTVGVTQTRVCNERLITLLAIYASLVCVSFVPCFLFSSAVRVVVVFRPIEL